MLSKIIDQDKQKYDRRLTKLGLKRESTVQVNGTLVGSNLSPATNTNASPQKGAPRSFSLQSVRQRFPALSTKMLKKRAEATVLYHSKHIVDTL